MTLQLILLEKCYCKNCVDEEYDGLYNPVCKTQYCIIQSYLVGGRDTIEYNPGLNWDDVKIDEYEELINNIIKKTMNDIIVKI